MKRKQLYFWGGVVCALGELACLITAIVVDCVPMALLALLCCSVCVFLAYRTYFVGKKAPKIRSLAAAPHIFWAILFIVLPLIIVIFYAFTKQNADGSFSFSFENIASLPDYAPIFWLSLELAIIATFICLLIGYPLAYMISRAKPKTQKILIMLLMLPMWTNLLIRTYSLMAIFDDGGFLNQLLGSMFDIELHIIGTKGAVIFGMVYDFLPYMVLPIYTCISKIDKNMWEAAADLGCNTVNTMTRVILPLSISGIISGVTMVLVPSISTFYISQKLGGGTFEVIGDTIERQFVTGALNVGAAISLVMMILILISITIMNKFSDEDGGIVV